MKKIIITLLSILVILIAAIIGVVLFNKSQKDDNIQVAENNNETVTDECTEEYEQLEGQNQLIEETSSEDIKISPNCSLTMKRLYKECGHTIEEYSNIPERLVNKTESDIQSEYQGWTIEKFSSNDVILYREFDSQCGEHYVLRDKDGKVTIYLINGDGTEQEIEQTEIATEFLTETDKIELENGIKANGKQELNQIIEDFE